MVHQVAGLEPTTDIDICPLLDPENIDRLRDALSEMHAAPFFEETAQPTSLADLLADPDRLRQAKAVMLVTEWGALDLVIRPDGIGQGYRTLEPQAEVRPAVDPDGNRIDLDVPVASIHHIYLSKKEAGRPKDLRALPHLARALRTQLLERQRHGDAEEPRPETDGESVVAIPPEMRGKAAKASGPTPGDGSVQGHHRADGTWVRSHKRRPTR